MRRFLALALLSGLAACSPAKPTTLTGESLPTLGGGSTAPGLCPAEKCLTAYVAPWCGYCRAATPALIKLKAYLENAGVPMRVIVGMDSLDSVKEYAAVFGKDVLLDPDNRFGVNGGVPHFYVTNKTGQITRDLAGMPQLSSAQDLAQYFGLP